MSAIENISLSLTPDIRVCMHYDSARWRLYCVDGSVSSQKAIHTLVIVKTVFIRNISFYRHASFALLHQYPHICADI